MSLRGYTLRRAYRLVEARIASLRGPEFEDVSDEAFEDIEYAEGLCYDRLLNARGGQQVLRALRACKAIDEDEAHFSGPDGELLRALADGDCEPRIEVKRAVHPFNPVALLSPRAEDALCAVAAEPILPGEPIAVYAGDLVTASDVDASAPNAYLYALDADELRARGFAMSATSLRVDASRRGSEARYINDKWGGGLPDRQPNCFVELIYDAVRRAPLLIFFASRRIAKGREVIADYGPDYWESALASLLEQHGSDVEARQPALAAAQSQGQARG